MFDYIYKDEMVNALKREQVWPSQVKKHYWRRKLVRVTPVMLLLTDAALQASLQGLGL